MKVFVTGASGFVGRQILEELRTGGHDVRILVRHLARAQAVGKDGGVELFQGDILNAGSLRGAMDGVEVVIHLVGIISEFKEATFENVHQRGTENAVAAANLAGVRRFLHMSALGTRSDAVARYHRSKWAAEELVRRSGLAFTIFRPSIIYGPDDAFVNLFARLSRFSPVLPVMGRGDGTFQPISVEDVARCFVRALTEPNAVGRTFDLVGPEILTFDEVLDAILSVLGRKRMKLHWPLPLARTLAALMEAAYPKIFGKGSPLSRDQILMLQEKTKGGIQPMKETFAVYPPPFREGIARYLKPSGSGSEEVSPRR